LNVEFLFNDFSIMFLFFISPPELHQYFCYDFAYYKYHCRYSTALTNFFWEDLITQLQLFDIYFLIIIFCVYPMFSICEFFRWCCWVSLHIDLVLIFF